MFGICFKITLRERKNNPEEGGQRKMKRRLVEWGKQIHLRFISLLLLYIFEIPHDKDFYKY